MNKCNQDKVEIFFLSFTIFKSLLHSLSVQRLLRTQQESLLERPSSCNKIPQGELHLWINGMKMHECLNVNHKERMSPEMG